MKTLEVGSRLAVALILGAIIGLERQWHQRTAGIRTNALVCVGACGFVIYASLFPGEASPTRIAGQIVSGIGFLGAGVIMREGLSVIGLNSAATIWCSSTVGVFCGGGYFIEASMITGMIMTINLLLRQFITNIKEKILPDQPRSVNHYVLHINCNIDHHQHLRIALIQSLKERHFKIKNFDVATFEGRDVVAINVALIAHRKDDKVMNDIVTKLGVDPDVVSARWYYSEPDHQDL